MRKDEAEGGDVRQQQPKQRAVRRTQQPRLLFALRLAAGGKADAAHQYRRRHRRGGDGDQPHKKADQALQRPAADGEGEDDAQHRQPAADAAGGKQVCALLFQQPRHRLFALGARLLFVLRGGDALPAGDLVAGHAVQLGEGGQHRDIGAAHPRFPVAHRLVGNAQKLRRFRLRISLCFSEGGEEPAYIRLRHCPFTSCLSSPNILPYRGYVFKAEGAYLAPKFWESL